MCSLRRVPVPLLFAMSIAVPRLVAAQVPSSTLPAIESRYVRADSGAWTLTVVRDTIRQDYGTMVEAVSLTTYRGDPAVLLVRTFPTPGGPIVDSALSVRATLAPIWQRSHQPTKTMRLEFGPAGVTGSYTPRDSGERAVHHPLHEPTFDGTSLTLVIAALPLKLGFETVLPEYIFEKAGTESDTVRVSGAARVAGPDGAMHDAWMVTSNNADVKIEYTIDRQTHAILQQVIVPRRGSARYVMTRVR